MFRIVQAIVQYEDVRGAVSPRSLYDYDQRPKKIWEARAKYVELKVDLILQSLINSFEQFIVNYHMNKLDCNLPELINMLVTAKGILKNSRGSVLAAE